MITIKKVQKLKELFLIERKKYYYLEPTDKEIKHFKQLNDAIVLLETYSNKKQLEHYLINTLDNLKTMLYEGLRPNKLLFSSNDNVEKYNVLTNKEKTIIKEQIVLIQFVLG
jgi:hypothetical protein